MWANILLTICSNLHNNPKQCYTEIGYQERQPEKLKSRKMKEGWIKSDEGWMKSDKGWRMNDEGWCIQAVEGHNTLY